MNAHDLVAVKAAKQHRAAGFFGQSSQQFFGGLEQRVCQAYLPVQLDHHGTEHIAAVGHALKHARAGKLAEVAVDTGARRTELLHQPFGCDDGTAQVEHSQDAQHALGAGH